MLSVMNYNNIVVFPKPIDSPKRTVLLLRLPLYQYNHLHSRKYRALCSALQIERVRCSRRLTVVRVFAHRLQIHKLSNRYVKSLVPRSEQLHLVNCPRKHN